MTKEQVKEFCGSWPCLCILGTVTVIMVVLVVLVGMFELIQAIWNWL